MKIKFQKGNDAPKIIRCKRPRGWSVNEAIGLKFGCEFESVAPGYWRGVQRFPDHNVVVSVWINEY